MCICKAMNSFIFAPWQTSKNIDLIKKLTSTETDYIPKYLCRQYTVINLPSKRQLSVFNHFWHRRLREVIELFDFLKRKWNCRYLAVTDVFNCFWFIWNNFLCIDQQYYIYAMATVHKRASTPYSPKRWRAEISAINSLLWLRCWGFTVIYPVILCLILS